MDHNQHNPIDIKDSLPNISNQLTSLFQDGHKKIYFKLPNCHGLIDIPEGITHEDLDLLEKFMEEFPKAYREVLKQK